MPARRKLTRSTQVSRSLRSPLSTSPQSLALTHRVYAQKLDNYVSERERGDRNRRARQLAGFIRANVAAKGHLQRA